MHSDLGARIWALRERRGLTRKELSRRTGLSEAFIWALEHGQKGISAQNLHKITEALSTNIQNLFAETHKDIVQLQKRAVNGIHKALEGARQLDDPLLKEGLEVALGEAKEVLEMLRVLLISEKSLEVELLKLPKTDRGIICYMLKRYLKEREKVEKEGIASTMDEIAEAISGCRRAVFDSKERLCAKRFLYIKSRGLGKGNGHRYGLGKKLLDLVHKEQEPEEVIESLLESLKRG